MFKLLLFLAFLSLSLFSTGQNSEKSIEAKTITYNQLFNELTTGSDSIYELRDVKVLFGKEHDSINPALKTTTTPDTLIVHKKVVFQNVEFVVTSRSQIEVINNFKFLKAFEITDCKNLTFKSCIFEDEFYYRNDKRIKDEYFNKLSLEKCVFNSQVKIGAYDWNKNFS